MGADDYIVGFRVVDNPAPSVGAHAYPCATCDRKVWITPESRKLGGRTLCLQCWKLTGEPAENVGPISSGQLREMIESRRARKAKNA